MSSGFVYNDKGETAGPCPACNTLRVFQTKPDGEIVVTCLACEYRATPEGAEDDGLPQV
jgi:hypothetical protein